MSIQTDLKDLLRECRMSRKRFARLAGVNPCALSRFLCHPGSSIAERVAPWLYGERRRELLPGAPEAEGAQSPRSYGKGFSDESGPCRPE